MRAGSICGRLWLKKKIKDWIAVKVLDFRQGSGSDISTGDRGRSRVLGGAARSRAGLS